MDIDIISLLSTDGYIMCNKTLIKMFGGDCAILIGELCAEYNYYKSIGKLTPADSFYSTQENIEENTGLNSYHQRKALSTLQDAEIIKVNKQGLPAKNYYWINKDVLIKLFTPCSTSALNFKGLEVENLNLNKNKQQEKETNTILSKDNIVQDSVESKMYTKSDFLGSRKTNVVKPKNKKTAPGASNLFDKCMREIDAYTRNLQIHELLVEYLKLRLAMKDKPIYGVSQWIGILRKLDSVIAEDQSQKEEDIIRQSIERGYASFFPVSKNIKKTDPFSEYGIVNCEQAKPEDISDVEF